MIHIAIWTWDQHRDSSRGALARANPCPSATCDREENQETPVPRLQRQPGRKLFAVPLLHPCNAQRGSLSGTNRNSTGNRGLLLLAQSRLQDLHEPEVLGIGRNLAVDLVCR